MLLFVLTACEDPPPPPEAFSVLQPAFFQSLAVGGETLAATETRLETAATAWAAKADPSPEEREELGRIQLYAGFLPHNGVHLVEDGYLESAALPNRVAAMERSRERLSQAAALRPEDTRIPVMLRSVDFNLAVLRGQDTAPVVDAMVGAAAEGWFPLFAALDLLRDPAAHPMSAPYMDRLLHLTCAPERFGCDGPPPEGAGPAPDGTLTRSVVGPILASDLLVRRAEHLLAGNDPASLPETMGRLGAANGLLAYATGNVNDPALSRFPFPDALPARAERIAALEATARARMGGAQDPVPDATAWYASKAYAGPYQCAACHTYGTEKAGIPK